MKSAIATLAVTLLVAGCSREVEPRWPTIPTAGPMRIPSDNPLTPEKVRLGRRLFSDARLSSDRTTSCSGCHDSQYGYTIGASRPVGAYRAEQNRACPSLVVAAYHNEFFWEGSATTLEKAVDGVWRYILVPPGQGRPTAEEVTERLNADAGLKADFEQAFGSRATPDNVVKALASFIRTLIPADAAWVRFYSGESTALPEDARRGYEIFSGKARCAVCHSGVLLTDRQYHNIGAGEGTGDTEGRYVMTKDERDRGAFKTPTLLNVGRSAPYFHDNSTPRLEEAVDRMLSGGFPGPNIDPQLRPVQLTTEERRVLLAFLRALDADPDGERPSRPQSSGVSPGD